MTTTNRVQTPEEPTIGRLVADTTTDLSALVRDEIQLAKTELKFSVKAGGTGSALFAAAAFLVLLADRHDLDRVRAVPGLVDRRHGRPPSSSSSASTC